MQGRGAQEAVAESLLRTDALEATCADESNAAVIVDFDAAGAQQRLRQLPSCRCTEGSDSGESTAVRAI